MSHDNGKQLWIQTADKDGWISKNTDEVMDSLNISGYDERKEAESDLNEAMNYYNTEFENQTEQRWRFTD